MPFLSRVHRKTAAHDALVSQSSILAGVPRMALWQNNGKKPHEKGHTMAQNYWGDELPSRVDLPPAADPARPGYGRIDFDKGY